MNGLGASDYKELKDSDPFSAKEHIKECCYRRHQIVVKVNPLSKG